MAISAEDPAIKASYSEFDVYTDTYAMRGPEPIRVHVLVPKTLKAGAHPVFLNFHAGFLVTGSALEPDYLPPLVRRAVLVYSAVLVSADYTLLPNPSGLKPILEDVDALHLWLHGRLANFLSERTAAKADLSRLLVHGSSAGGYVALAYALAHPQAVRALSLVYPMIDFDTRWWREGPRAVGAPNPMNMADADFGTAEEARRLLITLRDGPASTAAGDERDVALRLVYHGLFGEVVDGSSSGETEGVRLVRRVAAAAALPGRVWVLHGDADTLVPIDTSRAFAATMAEQGRPVRLDVVPGKEHAFDIVPPSDDFNGAEEPVIVNGQAWLAEAWLAAK